MSTQDKSHPAITAPTVSIYQNSDHVSGILQQIFNMPLVTSETIATHGSNTQKTQDEGTGEVKANLETGLPGVGKVAFGAGVGGSNITGEESLAGHNTTRNYLYSQAYYLSAVRNELRNRNLIKNVLSGPDAENVKSGDFVEFTASFSPNQVSALLDIITPELVAEIARYIVRTKKKSNFDNFEDIEALRQFALNIETDAKAVAELSQSIAKAARTDFRAHHTREYYGQIGTPEDGVTAITICDNEHFTVQDEDRMLDGRFTVLGKATSGVERDVAILARNKLLRRIDPEAIDSLFESLKEQAASKNDVELTEEIFNDAIDVALDSRINGDSFRVIPIAVFT